MLGRRAPLTVYGPPGLRAKTRSILEAYQADIRIRTEGAEMLATGGVQVQANEIEPGVVYEDGLVTVEAFAVPHGTWEHAFGYKFTTVDRTVVISGDSGPNDELATIARDADILVHEAYGAFGFFQRRPQAQGYHGTFHTSATKVGEIASQANVGMVVLTHQLHLAGESPDPNGRRSPNPIRRTGGLRERPGCFFSTDQNYFVWAPVIDLVSSFFNEEEF
ncbi:MAG: hypothetical protein Ct9H300mP25_15870 [Acidobacteriota bacterium]|nr:MAG: hypothetical protein Ct9H300mP25_15870 [Acidobacteriota bacterium]